MIAGAVSLIFTSASVTRLAGSKLNVLRTARTVLNVGTTTEPTLGAPGEGYQSVSTRVAVLKKNSRSASSSSRTFSITMSPCDESGQLHCCPPPAANENEPWPPAQL